MTGRLYYTDSYLIEFQAEAIEVSSDGLSAILDRTAFYPASGGQPFDTGTLNGVPVAEVIDDGDVIRHQLAGPLAPGPVAGRVDFTRRFDHMQQHTGQHLLSAVFADEFGLETISFHLGRELCTIDLAVTSLPGEWIEAAERRANEEIVRNRTVRVDFEDAATAAGLRKPSDRDGTIRVVTIDGLDRSACGGTHVRATGEIGLLVTAGTEKVRQSTRLEFACGHRARQSLTAQRTSASAQIAQLQERVAELEKERRKIVTELAASRGRELSSATPANAAGWRLAERVQPALDDAVRAEATAYVQQGRGAYLAVAGRAVLLAVTPGLGVDAGQILRPFLEKGGGSATIAQGTLREGSLPRAILDALGAATVKAAAE